MHSPDTGTSGTKIEKLFQRFIVRDNREYRCIIIIFVHRDLGSCAGSCLRTVNSPRLATHESCSKTLFGRNQMYETPIPVDLDTSKDKVGPEMHPCFRT